jgi:hypothetical protein
MINSLPSLTKRRPLDELSKRRTTAVALIAPRL